METNESSLVRAASAVIIVAGIVAFLTLTQSILIPLILGLLLWFVMHQLNGVLNQVAYIKRNFSKTLLTVFSGMIVLLVVIILGSILSDQISTLRVSYDKYRDNFTQVIDQINGLVSVDIRQAFDFTTGDLTFGNMIGKLLNSLTGVVSSLFMVIVYAAFVAAEETNFSKKMGKILLDRRQLSNYEEIIDKIEFSVSRYLGLKSIVSLVTGVASYVALRLLGIESAGFWAFLIFLLNFIPTVGSLIATLFPAIFAVLQFVDIWPGVYVLIAVGVIQLIVGNALEPKLMGNSLNISPLVTILSLSLWGLMWGIMGMILSVPITVIIIIILSNFPRTRNVAILLSEKGNI